MELISLQKEEMSLANQILKEIDEVEEQRREEQYNNVLEAYRKHFKDNGSTLFYYSSILYDEVRQRLDREGFKVRTVTYNGYGYVSYLITRKEDFAVNKEVVRPPLE